MADNAMLDLTQVNQNLQKAVAGVQTASQTAIDLLPAVVENTQKVNEAYDAQADLLDQSVNKSFEALMEIQSKARTVDMNPFSEIIGLFNPDYNVQVLARDAATEELKLKKVAQNAAMLENKKNRVLQSVTAPLSAAQMQLSISRDVLGAQREQFQTDVALLQRQEMEIAKSVRGATPEQLKKAYESGNPGAIHPDAQLGDIYDAMVKKSESGFSLQAAQLAVENARFDQSVKKLDLMNKLRGDYLVRANPEDLQSALGKAGTDPNGTVEVNGIPFTRRELEAGVLKSQQEDIAAGTSRMEMRGKLGATSEQAMQASTELLRVASVVTGGIEGLEGTDIQDIDTSKLPPEIAGSVKQVQAWGETAATAKDPATRLMAQQKQIEVATAQSKAWRDSLTKNLEKPHQAAYDQFFTTGRVVDLPIAAESLSATLLAQPLGQYATTNPGLGILFDATGAEYKKELSLGSGMSLPSIEGGSGAAFFLSESNKGKRDEAFGKAVQNASMARTPTPQEIEAAAKQGKQIAGTKVESAPNRALGEWWSEYTTSILTVLQEQKTPGFEGIVNPNTGFLNIPGNPKPGVDTLLQELYVRGKNLKDAGVIADENELFNVFYREITNPNRVKTYSDSRLSPTTPDEANMYRVYFMNNQKTHFVSTITAMRNAYYADDGAVAAAKRGTAAVAAQSPFAGSDNPFAPWR